MAAKVITALKFICRLQIFLRNQTPVAEGISASQIITGIGSDMLVYA